MIALGPSFSDPLGATSSKPGVVEFFWQVRKSEEREKCNMELSLTRVHIGCSVILPEDRMQTKPAGEFKVPTMISSTRISAGSELVCYFKNDGEAKIKRAKVS